MSTSHTKPRTVNGWIRVWREAFGHEIVGIRGRAFTEFEAWLWLIAEAAYEPTTVYCKGVMGAMVVLEPGQLMHSRRHLATRWSWTEDKVRWFLRCLVSEKMIAKNHTQPTPSKPQNRAQQHTNQIPIITISNYGQYQLTKQKQHPASHPANHQPTSNQHPKAKKKRIPKDIDSPNGESVARATDERATRNEITILEAYQGYNNLALRLGLPQARTLTPAYRTAIRARMREHGGPEAWQLMLDNIERSALLQGKKTDWRPPGLSWFIKASNFTKVVEGAYSDDVRGDQESQADRFARIGRELAQEPGHD